MNPTAAILVIGDEILSGRTRDSNMHFLAQELARVGIDLQEARVVPDRHPIIVAAVRALSEAHDHVFTSGGIGPTHDDITADAVAEAMGVPLGVREDARSILQAHYDRMGVEINEARLRMARVPEGATLIDNPVSAAPGFSIRNVHVMAGVPRIFEAMAAGLLPRLTGGTPLLSQSYRILKGEGEIAGPLAILQADFPDLLMGSYPFQQNGAFGANIVIRGPDGGRLHEAMTRLAALFPE
ncbi:competence/damage-inducible protein A [Rubellimicrobium roseum]|uniref:Competence/damage-inducible protein A n=1 Tax=Rubellimicrobium roseum TaxID=687525 RepID=A0A5C4N701_9RHOB|nr:competence/damage-inducible protein A [Rubellimicrobium roseum]TNC61950.1 competence/damage-inducible protein A [Rubellimicrobium roseum]